MLLHVLHIYSIVLLNVMVVTTTAFPILYAARSNWRQTAAGQSVMVSTVALALLVDISVFGEIVHNISHLVGDILTAFVFTMVFAGSVYKLATLVAAQRFSRETAEREASEASAASEAKLKEVQE